MRCPAVVDHDVESADLVANPSQKSRVGLVADVDPEACFSMHRRRGIDIDADDSRGRSEVFPPHAQ
jgi:hypothetical protein